METIAFWWWLGGDWGAGRGRVEKGPARNFIIVQYSWGVLRMTCQQKGLHSTGEESFFACPLTQYLKSQLVSCTDAYKLHFSLRVSVFPV